MMTSHRPRGQVGGSFANRRGHTNQLSISDPSHHVTEAIGTMYGDEDDPAPDQPRPLSFIGGSTQQEQIMTLSPSRAQQSAEPRRPLQRSTSDQPHLTVPQHGEHGSLKKAQTMPLQISTSQRSNSNEPISKSPRSPTISLRDVQADPSTSQFTLTNIDNPNDIAQELSNLQALRRMSMDVGNVKDPDMPPMSLSSMPVIAPSGDDDENDPSRLLWVPARVHPELAPTEFQSFLETRVNSIRRRSRDSLSPDGLSRSDSTGSLGGGDLRRQRSTLSKQIDDSGESSYVDGAERLEHQRSLQGHNRELSLDDLVKDPATAVQKLAQESQAPADGSDNGPNDVILPMAPGMGLRRSTRTTYRKGGSLRSGDKPLSRRIANRKVDSDAADNGVPPMPDAPPGHGLTRVQSEPISENRSRPSRSLRRPQGIVLHESPDALAALEGAISPTEEKSRPSLGDIQENISTRDTSASSSADLRGSEPQSPPQDDRLPQRSASGSQQPSFDEYSAEPVIAEPPPKSSRRKVGQPTMGQQQPQPEQSVQPPPQQQPSQPQPQHQMQYNSQPPPQQQYISKSPPQAQTQNLNDQLSSGPSPMPGVGSSRTDNLTFIPTMNEDKKNDKKSKKDRDDDSSSTKSSSSAWKWFKSSGDDKKKDDGKKSKTKTLVEKAQDNVRLDVIQNSIEKTAPKTRESFVLDRDAVDSKLQEERKKENNRRSDSKKEKDGNIFSSIFGGSKKKEEKERNSKKAQHLRVPSEPPAIKPLEPDVDYHWTRFPLLEERAIYRMAHIKLANPRRPLASQVLLSNFMYSYLAIVQAMHPNMNVPVSPQQKRLEEEARRKREEEEYQQQLEDGQDDLSQYDFDYHRATARYADEADDETVDYVDDAQIYEDEHGSDHHHYHHHQQQQQHHHNHRHQRQEYDYDEDHYDDKDYYQYHDNGGHRRHDGRGDMW